MEKDWVRVYSTTENYRAHLVMNLLESHEIECVMMDKKDSIYGVFGEIEIYTKRDLVLRAINIIQKGDL